MIRKWSSIGISREVYVSSSGHYYFVVWLIDCHGKRLKLDYNLGDWLYANSKNYREFTPPAYVVAMFTAKFAEMHAAEMFTFYEYRKVGNELIKDDDAESLRYHDAQSWRWVVEGILGKETVR